MTARRATAYAGLAALLAGWLAAAASVSRPERQTKVPARPQEAAVLDDLARDVQSQADRLRHRMASAPEPQPVRNPFVFAARPMQAARVSPPNPSPAVVDVPAPEPPLALLGIAENKTAKGLTRTAIIGADGDEVLMAVEGQELAGRYRVVAIGPDIVELKDLTTGANRRLVLR